MVSQQNILRIPGALNDAANRANSARAVLSCVIETIPCGDHTKPLRYQLDAISNLVAAASDVLDLLIQDIETTEVQLIATKQGENHA